METSIVLAHTQRLICPFVLKDDARIVGRVGTCEMDGTFGNVSDAWPCLHAAEA